MKVLVSDQRGKLVKLNDVVAKTLMQAMRDAGLNLTAQCGGCASCGTCHVYVDDTWRAKLKPIGEIEDAMLDVVEERKESSRLSCQIELTEDLDGLTVTLAPGAAFA
ncbi:2Fe-2S iron-sulfur cluster binding domain-containing protein [Bradyrhizobium diazoefficiens]|uniref:2Fe-2S iron-sulfur cluster-binding protein n=1 Tax=Bradyrhizobium diazoefficiens TaxID=1355477 RepID=UPI001909A2A7|nr:2Fe-2S iron-sulfur cluster-binding protein [Bradyrhizobium diazoefficiens]QQO35552.1 2Fe-2S iron-sulfur cluster binding domain-containing protein [Bradyrhizobium diazoefficiens]